jgi:signal transduction histidine kinase
LAAAHQRHEAELDGRERLEAAVAHASEREQLRLGQELHDGLGQQLAGVGFLLTALHMRAKEVDPGIAADVDPLREMLAESLRLTRNLAKGFYPVELETLGLLPALEAAARGTSQLYGVQCVVEPDHSHCGTLTGPRAIQLFRVAQQAMHNAVTHAGAKRVVICLAADDRELTLTVDDDGIGFRTISPGRAVWG